jgi:hypothetical protein
VTGESKIRFFAGAPLLAEDGHIIGVLSIHSKYRRRSFGPFERRRLAEYATIVMGDLKNELDKLERPAARSTPILQRNSVINGDRHQITFIRSEQDEEHDPALVPPALRVSKPKTQVSSKLGISANSRTILETPSQRKPSSSAGSAGSPQTFAGYRNQTPSDSSVNGILSSPRMATPEHRDFDMPSPRPFSSSDMSSLNPHPANTPVHSRMGRPTLKPIELTVEHFLSMSDRDVSEDADDNLSAGDGISLASKNPYTGYLSHSTTMTSMAPLGSPPPIPPRPPFLTRPPRLSSPAAITDTIYEDDDNPPAINQLAPTHDPMAQAALACAQAAQSLGYDLLYAVELNPSRKTIEESQLFSPGVLDMRIMAAYGMKRPLDFSPQLHIDTLRCRGFYYWEAPRQSNNQPSEYQSGCLIAIPTQGGIRRLRTSGIIMGAFKKSKLADDTSPGNSAKLQQLIDVGNLVKKLLWTDPESPLRPLPRRSRTEPMLNPYPANEAVEVGGSSSGDRLSRQREYERQQYALNIARYRQTQQH